MRGIFCNHIVAVSRSYGLNGDAGLTGPYDVQYKYDLYITKEPVILPLKHHLLLPERYERDFLDSYGSCEQKLQTQRRCRDTTHYDVQYKYDLYIVRSRYFFL